MLTVAQCYAAPTTGWIKAMTIHSSGAITAHQGITGSSGRRLEEQADEHGAAIKEHDAAINDLRRRRRLEECASERIEKLEATLKKMVAMNDKMVAMNDKMAKRIEMLEAALEKLSKK